MNDVRRPASAATSLSPDPLHGGGDGTLVDRVVRGTRINAIALGYLIVSAVWIILSDHIVAVVFADTAMVSRAQTLKGWAFVITTTILLAVLLRVTHRKLRAREHEVAEARAYLQLALESAREGIWDWDMRDDSVHWSPRLLSLLELSPGDFDGTFGNVQRLVHPHDLKVAMTDIDRCVSGATPMFQCSYRMRRKDGEWIWLQAFGQIVERNASGEPVRMIGTTRDVNDLYRAEARLGESEALLHDAERIACLGAWQHGLNDGRLTWSDQVYEIFCLNPTQFSPTYDAFLQLVHPGDRQRMREAHRRALANEALLDQEHRIICGDGTQKIVHERGRLILDDNGQPARLVGTVQDVTSRKRTEEALRRKETELAHLDRVSTLGQMAAGIAHELNQPLTAISGFSSANLILLESAEFPGVQQVREASRQIVELTDRGAEIIRRIPGFVRQHQSRRVTADLHALIRESLELAEFLTRGAGVATEFDGSDPGPKVIVDGVQVQQVLVNLLRNAVESMQDTAPENRTINVGTKLNARTVEVHVSDRGHGLPDEFEKQVFQPFVSTKAGGMGMGLAISETIVQQHGGRLWAERNESGGATFRFTLPLATQH